MDAAMSDRFRGEPQPRGRVENAIVRVLVLAGSFAVFGAAAPSAQAQQSVADFYRGKTITYNLATPDGASWGLYARTFIEHFRKHIPGNPNVILQVMPGAGGVNAANYMYTIAPKDGTMIGTPLSTSIVFAATDPTEVRSTRAASNGSAPWRRSRRLSPSGTPRGPRPSRRRSTPN
jgi:hypothetical protein